MRIPGSKVRADLRRSTEFFKIKLESIVLELNEYLYDDGGKIA